LYLLQGLINIKYFFQFADFYISPNRAGFVGMRGKKAGNEMYQENADFMDYDNELNYPRPVRWTKFFYDNFRYIVSSLNWQKRNIGSKRPRLQCTWLRLPLKFYDMMLVNIKIVLWILWLQSHINLMTLKYFRKIIPSHEKTYVEIFQTFFLKAAKIIGSLGNLFPILCSTSLEEGIAI